MVIRVEPKVLKIQRERGLTGVIGGVGNLINSVESIWHEPLRKIPVVSGIADAYVGVKHGILGAVGGVGRKLTMPIDQAWGTMSSEFAYYKIG